MKTIELKYSELKFDMNFYPRQVVDTTHVSHIAEAIQAGAVLPPIIIASKDNAWIVIDGFHRANAFKSLAGVNAVLTAEIRTYKSDAEMILDAIRLNANHGRNLTPADRAHCAVLASKFDVDASLLADALNMTQDRVEEFMQTRVTRIEGTRRKAILKLPVRHMAGQILSEEQENTIKHLPGNHQVFVVNTLIRLIESKLLDVSNERLLERLEVLKGLLKQI